MNGTKMRISKPEFSDIKWWDYVNGTNRRNAAPPAQHGGYMARDVLRQK